MTKILLVDDSKFLRMATERALARAGYQVSTAEDGPSALDRAKREKPDVILLDWVMPLMDGGEVLSRLREATNSDIPVIVVSGQPQPEENQGDPRIHSWLTKPITIDELVDEVVGRALARQPG